MAVVFASVAELVCRVVLAPVGRRWEYWHPLAATKFEFLRDASTTGLRIRTLIVGDSTGAADFDPRVFETALQGRSWNAAWSGNFPLAFRESTLPLLEDPKLNFDYVIASFIPAGFTGSDRMTPSEAAIVGSAYVQKIQGIRQTGDYLYLSRFRSAWPFLLGTYGRYAEPLTMTNFGYEPLKGEISRNVDRRESAVGPTNVALSPLRFAVLRRLIAAATQKGATVVVVIPPSLSEAVVRGEMAAQLNLALQNMTSGANLLVLDMTKPAFLNSSHFVDLNHLNAIGAELLSRETADEIRRAAASDSNPNASK